MRERRRRERETDGSTLFVDDRRGEERWTEMRKLKRKARRGARSARGT